MVRIPLLTRGFRSGPEPGVRLGADGQQDSTDPGVSVRKV